VVHSFVFVAATVGGFGHGRSLVENSHLLDWPIHPNLKENGHTENCCNEAQNNEAQPLSITNRIDRFM
jgi:hypothetical protein